MHLLPNILSSWVFGNQQLEILHGCEFGNCIFTILVWTIISKKFNESKAIV